MSTNIVNKDTGELVALANGTRMWIGTQSAHDLAVQLHTMPNNCMVCITDDAAGDEAWQYSTSETRTGKTWIDGKPIYRKCGTVTINTHSEILLDSILKSSYVATVIDSRITITYYGFKFIAVGYTLAEDKISLGVGSSGLTLRPNTLSLTDITGQSYWVIEYTKTTD